MTELLRIGEVAKAVGVTVETLRRWEAAGRVTFVRQGNRRFLPADELGALVRAHHPGHARISAGNRLPGVITAVEVDGVMAKVEMACGPYRLVSLMSVEAARDLGLEPGIDAAALIESINVMVDR
jgi:molybdopterin-binding protein